MLVSAACQERPHHEKLAKANYTSVASHKVFDRNPKTMTRSAWRQEREAPSMSEVFRTIAVGNGGTSRFRRFLAFIGPGYLVAVGYMDPGNWATSLAGGAAFGYTLLFVALLFNIMAILLQSLCARRAVASG